MKVLDVLFFYYYRIYKSHIPSWDPVDNAILSLGFSLGFPLFCITDSILALFCLEVGRTLYILIILAPTLTLYYLYKKTNRHRKVLRKKPKLFNSHIISKLIVGGLFVFAISSLFWGAPLAKYITDTVGCEHNVVVEEIIWEWMKGLFSAG